MAKILTNIHTDRMYFFNDALEKTLRSMLNCNQHDEIRCEIAKRLKLDKYVERFAEYAKLPYKTMEQLSERYELTSEMLSVIENTFGKDAVTYVDQFL